MWLQMWLQAEMACNQLLRVDFSKCVWEELDLPAEDFGVGKNRPDFLPLNQ